jgi:hypothetical protein
MAAKLKVFRTHIGFDDLIVAVPSKKAALEAWGASAHLFAQGFAAATDEPALVKAALARPGVILRRQFGTQDEFKPGPSAPRLPKSLPKIPAAKSVRPDRTHEARPTARSPDRAAEARERRQRAAAERAELRVEKARARAAAKEREKEERQVAAQARRDLQGELEAVARERLEQLRAIEDKEAALARERRDVEQSFETRLVTLRRRLRKA